jgi:predicted branched-subunit amino acid permease
VTVTVAGSAGSEALANQQEIRRAGFGDGARSVLPLLLAIIPFGLVLGVASV